jgi:hypothetical protein
MSQSLRSLNRVANLSGRRGFVLRPLSALRLEPTVPELDGRIDRARLLDLEGRSRRRQFELAERWGIAHYPQPAGGCLLTDPNFSRRVRDLFEHGPEPDAHAIELLKIGRQFRIREGVKATVGKNDADNRALLALRAPGDTLVRTHGVPGPVAIVGGAASETDLAVVAGICARYSDGRAAGAVRVVVEGPGGERELLAHAIADDELIARRL